MGALPMARGASYPSAQAIQNPAIADGVKLARGYTDERHTVLVNDHAELIFIGNEIDEFIITWPKGANLLKVFDIQVAVTFCEPVFAPLLHNGIDTSAKTQPVLTFAAINQLNITDANKLLHYLLI